MFIKVHKSYRDVVAICDENLIGKTFEEGEFQLEIKKDFYEGDRVSEEKLIETVLDLGQEDATFNIIGENSTKAMVKAKLIPKDSVKTIEGIPYSLILL